MSHDPKKEFHAALAEADRCQALAEKAHTQYFKVTGPLTELYKEMLALISRQKYLRKRKRQTPKLLAKLKAIDVALAKNQKGFEKLDVLQRPGAAFRAMDDYKDASKRFRKACKKAEMANFACTEHVN